MFPKGENEVFGVLPSGLGVADPGGDPGLFPNGENEAFGIFEAEPVSLPNGANDFDGGPDVSLIGDTDLLSTPSSLFRSDFADSSFSCS